MRKRLLFSIIVVLWCFFALTGCRKAEEASEQTFEQTLEQTLEQTKTILTEDIMTVHYIDVGQGDATLIQVGEAAMLIDAGSSGQGPNLQKYLMRQGITKLDYLVLTHPDGDHIGGADVIAEKYAVGEVFLGGFEKESAEYQEALSVLEEKGVGCIVPEVGDTYALGEAAFMILASGGEYDDANNSSVALMLEHGENRFLFTGDCGEEAEADILQTGLNVRCDVYKVGHHGSNSSSTEAFLEEMSPRFAVISCGENEYNHPHEKVLERLRDAGVEQIYRTDEQGSIVAHSDGNKIIWEVISQDAWVAEISEMSYVIANKKSGVFHKSDCKGLPAEWNQILFKTREDSVESGFANPCNYCNP